MTWEIDRLSCPTELEEEDILEAMKSIEGYLDITPSDFKEFYIKAYEQARKRLLGNITAEMIMHRPVYSVRSEENLSRAAQIMADANVSGLPVINADEKIVGVVSEKDFLRELSNDKNPSFMSVIAQCLNNKGCVALPVRKLTVKDIMTSDVVTADEKDTLADIINLLKKREINRIPVKDSSDRLTGIITRSDIIKILFNAVCSY